jgi:protein SCO1/2
MKKLFALCAFALLLAGCDKVATAPAPFNGVDITGAQYARDFALTDHTGKKRTLADFRARSCSCSSVSRNVRTCARPP